MKVQFLFVLTLLGILFILYKDNLESLSKSRIREYDYIKLVKL